jgi:hypothetical protein
MQRNKFVKKKGGKQGGKKQRKKGRPFQLKIIQSEIFRVNNFFNLNTALLLRIELRTEIGTQCGAPLRHDFLFVGIHKHLRLSPLRRRS